MRTGGSEGELIGAPPLGSTEVEMFVHRGNYFLARVLKKKSLESVLRWGVVSRNVAASHQNGCGGGEYFIFGKSGVNFPAGGGNLQFCGQESEKPWGTSRSSPQPEGECPKGVNFLM